MFKVNNRNTRRRRGICSKLTIKTPERRHWRHSGVFVVNFEYISHLVLVFLLLTLSNQMPAGQMSLMQRLALTLLQAVTAKVCKKDTGLQAVTLRYT